MAVLLGTILLLCSCGQTQTTNAPMEWFSFSHTGMSTGRIYTLTAEKNAHGWQAGFDLFCSQFFTLPMTEEEANTLRDLAEEYNLWTWHGYEKASRRVDDGEGFSLTIHFSDGQVISASGHQAFPKGYSEVETAILAFFTELMEKHGMENPF